MLQFVGSQGVGQDRATELKPFTFDIIIDLFGFKSTTIVCFSVSPFFHSSISPFLSFLELLECFLTLCVNFSVGVWATALPTAMRVCCC